MAKYNIWEQAGQPTSFNPLPTGSWNFKVESLSIGITYILTFQGRSKKSGTLRVIDKAPSYIDKLITLTSEFQKYRVEFTPTDSEPFYLYENIAGAAGDIELKDISLVEKPLGKVTVREAPKYPVGKNLFDGTYLEGYLTSTNYLETPTSGSNGQRTSKWMDCKPGKAYTVSGNDRSSWHFKDKNGVIGNGAVGGTITTPVDAVQMRVYYSSDGSHNKVQVEEGSSSTAYEPPILKTRRATKYPKKNMLPPVWNWIDNAQGVDQALGDYKLSITYNQMGRHYKYYVPIEAGKSYTFSCDGDGYAYSYFADETQARITGIINKGVTSVAPVNAKFAEVILNSNTGKEVHMFENWQFEEGSTSPFEPYRLVNRPAPKGLEFSGTVDRLAVSTPLSTLGNKDFEIESIFNYNPLNPGNAPQQSIISCGDIRFGISAVVNKQIGFYTPSTGWVSVSAPIDANRPIKLKAVIKPEKVWIYVDDILRAEKDYTGAINSTPQTLLHIASYAGTQYFYSGSLRTLKLTSEGVSILDFDFTKPQNNIGAKIKGNNGIDATVYGSPYQLNRQARR